MKAGEAADPAAVKLISRYNSPGLIVMGCRAGHARENAVENPINDTHIVWSGALKAGRL
jgi:hypothetical protein